MADLASFLLERIASDEEMARRAGSGEWGTASFAGGTAGRAAVVTTGVLAALALGMPDSSVVAWAPGPVELLTNVHIARWDPARVLAECDSKRRLIDMAFDIAEESDAEWGDGCSAERIRAGLCPDHGAKVAARPLRLLAVPFAGHPDYDETWAP